jgi:hypothetical protein
VVERATGRKLYLFLLGWQNGLFRGSIGRARLDGKDGKTTIDKLCGRGTRGVLNRTLAARTAR